MSVLRAWWIAIAVLLVASSATTVCADDPESSALVYWPLQPGTTWVRTDLAGREWTVRMVREDRLGGERMFVTEESIGGEVTTGDWLAIRNGRLMLVAVQQSTGGTPVSLPTPLTLWPSSTALGTRWSTHPAPGSASCVIDRQEEVTVPAGTFQALVVVCKTPISQTTDWRAPRVGVVRTLVELSGRRPVVSELLRFVPGQAADH